MEALVLNGSLMRFMDRVFFLLPHRIIPEEVKQDEEGLQIMRYLGRNMAWLLKLKEAGDKNGVVLPEQEETRIVTNFIK